MPRRNKVLITGSSGMLGVDLCHELSRDYDIYGLDIFDRSRGGFNLPYAVKETQRYVKCDITDRQSVSRAILEIKPDIVIHAAALTDVDGCERDKKRAYRINADGTKNVALACKSIGAVLVYISTDFVFDGKKKRPYRESDKTSPLGVYADSKLKGEAAVKKVLKKYFILRTSWLYGKNGKNFVDTIVAKAKELGSLKVVDDQVGSPTYAVDLAKAIGVLVDKCASAQEHKSASYGIYHVSNSGSVSWYEYAKAIVNIAKVRAKVLPISSDELDRPARRPAMSVLDNSKFMKFTRYKMRNWKTALKEYLCRADFNLPRLNK